MSSIDDVLNILKKTFADLSEAKNVAESLPQPKKEDLLLLIENSIAAVKAAHDRMIDLAFQHGLANDITPASLIRFKQP